MVLKWGGHKCERNRGRGDERLRKTALLATTRESRVLATRVIAVDVAGWFAPKGPAGHNRHIPSGTITVCRKNPKMRCKPTWRRWPLVLRDASVYCMHVDMGESKRGVSSRFRSLLCAVCAAVRCSQNESNMCAEIQ